MKNDAVSLLVLIPMVCAAVSLALMRYQRAQRMLGVASLITTFGLSVLWLVDIRDGSILVTQMGSWPAPFGITLVFDSLSGLLLAAASVVALGCYLHSFSSLDPATERRYFHPLIQLLMVGVNQSFLTGDLFNLFVAFEIMLMASYGLLTIGRSRRQMTQAYKYILLNVTASTVFVISAGLVYGMMGTLNIADLARIVGESAETGEPLPDGFTALAVLLLLVFGLKGAIFPLWFWLPDTYYTCPVAIGGLFSGLLTKVGIYAIARTFPLIFAVGEAGDVVSPLIAISAALTMLLGVLGAVSQHEVRRILALHVISQVGYMVFGIAMMTTAGLAGCLFYMIQHMVVKSSLFLCCGVMERRAGSDDLERVGGVLKRNVWLGTLFFIAAMSLVGLPPLSGFFGKLVLIQEGWNDYWWLSVIALVTGALTLLSMLKIWSYGYWSPEQSVSVSAPEVEGEPRGLGFAYSGITLLVVTALFVGLAAEPIYDVAFHAGEQLTDPTAYIEAVDLQRADVVSTALTDNAAGAG